jgi:hypothetical protein
MDCIAVCAKVLLEWPRLPTAVWLLVPVWYLPGTLWRFGAQFQVQRLCWSPCGGWGDGFARQYSQPHTENRVTAAGHLLRGNANTLTLENPPYRYAIVITHPKWTPARTSSPSNVPRPCPGQGQAAENNERVEPIRPFRPATHCLLCRST